MLGVPPKSSGGATNRCVMSRLTKCAAPDPFSDRIESSVPSAVLQVLRWGRRSATLRSVFAAHGPTSCFSPMRTGVLADLSRCKPLPGIAVNGALYGDMSPQGSPGAHQVPWLAPIMLVTGGWGARSCSQRRCNSLTGTPDERPRAARLRLISRPAPVHRRRPAAPRR